MVASRKDMAFCIYRQVLPAWNNEIPLGIGFQLVLYPKKDQKNPSMVKTPHAVLQKQYDVPTSQKLYKNNQCDNGKQHATIFCVDILNTDSHHLKNFKKSLKHNRQC